MKRHRSFASLVSLLFLLVCPSCGLETCPSEFLGSIIPRDGLSEATVESSTLLAENVQSAIDVAMKLDFAYYYSFIDLLLSVPKTTITGAMLDRFALAPNKGGLFRSATKGISFIPHVLHNNTDPAYASIFMNRSMAEQDMWWNSGQQAPYTEYRQSAFNTSLYGFTELTPSGARITRTDYFEYYPVHYIYPLSGNVRAVGYDLASNAVRQLAIKVAERTRGVAVTGRIVTVQSTYEQYAFLMFYPFFNDPADLSHFTTYERAPQGANTSGYWPAGLVSSVYVVQDLLGTALGNSLRRTPQAGSWTLVLVFQKLGYTSPGSTTPNTWQFMAGFSDVINASNDTFMQDFNRDWKNNREQQLNITAHNIFCATQDIDQSGTVWKLIVAVDHGCQPGEYLIAAGVPGKQVSVCGKCSDGLSCSGNYQDQIKVLPGYFVLSDQGIYSSYKCRKASTCSGGSIEGNQCAGTRKGFLCNTCPPGSFRTDNGCEDCGSGTSAIFVVVGVFAALVVVAIFVLSNHKVSTESPAKLVAVLTVGQLIAFLQVLASFSKTNLKWGHPLQAMLQIIGLISFDLTVIKVDCVGAVAPVAQYGLMMLLPIFGVTILFTMYFACRVTRCFPTNLDGLINGIGQIMIALLVTLGLATLTPFQCYLHPNGLRSLISHPEVICHDSDDWTIMATISGLAIIFYLGGTFTFVTYIIWYYPYAILKDSLSMVTRYRFLFVRWRPSCYWFMFPMMIRSFCLAIFPMVIPIERSDVVVLLQIWTILILTSVTIQYMPWRNSVLNAIDIFLNFLLLLLITVGSLSVYGTDLSDAISIFLGVMMLIGIAACTLIFLWKIHEVSYRSSRFAAFLSHHKAQGACSARFLKIALSRLVRGQVFFDSDNLSELNSLFDAVKQSDVLVVVLTAEIFSRPWCIGEIVVAHQCNIPLQAVSFDTQKDDKTWRLLAEQANHVLTEGEVLQPFGIAFTDIPTAINALFNEPIVRLDLADHSALYKHIESLASSIKDTKHRYRQPLLGKSASLTPSDTPRVSITNSIGFHNDKSEKDAAVFVMSDHSDVEALAAASSLRILLQQTMQKGILLDLEEYAVCPEKLFLEGKKAPIVLWLHTYGSLKNQEQLGRLGQIFKIGPSVKILPVIIGEAPVPTQLDYDRIQDQGGPSIELREVFSRIATRLNIGYISESLLKEVVKTIVVRLDALASVDAGIRSSAIVPHGLPGTQVTPSRDSNALAGMPRTIKIDGGDDSNALGGTSSITYSLPPHWDEDDWLAPVDENGRV